jgi:hypothetical protein
MTDNEINELKEFLQKKINILGPKKIKGLIKADIVDITFISGFFDDDGGSLEITVDADFDNNIGNLSVISDRIRKTSNFIKNLVSAVEPNKRCYVFWR